MLGIPLLAIGGFRAFNQLVAQWEAEGLDPQRVFDDVHISAYVVMVKGLPKNLGSLQL